MFLTSKVATIRGYETNTRLPWKEKLFDGDSQTKIRITQPGAQFTERKKKPKYKITLLCTIV